LRKSWLTIKKSNALPQIKVGLAKLKGIFASALRQLPSLCMTLPQHRPSDPLVLALFTAATPGNYIFTAEGISFSARYGSKHVVLWQAQIRKSPSFLSDLNGLYLVILQILRTPLERLFRRIQMASCQHGVWRLVHRLAVKSNRPAAARQQAGLVVDKNANLTISGKINK